MRAFSTLALAGLAWLALGSTAFADVRISIHDGQVSLAAKDATVRQILTEWARVGQHPDRERRTNFRRSDHASNSTTCPNRRRSTCCCARSAATWPRRARVAVSDASQFDRIIVMPTSAAPRPAPSAAPPPPAPFAQLNGIMPQPQDDDDNRQQPGLQLPPALAPIFSNFPQQQRQPGQRPTAAAAHAEQRPGHLRRHSQQQVDPQNGQPHIGSRRQRRPPRSRRRRLARCPRRA